MMWVWLEYLVVVVVEEGIMEGLVGHSHLLRYLQMVFLLLD